MDYMDMIDRVQRLDFITDPDMADAACKAVWGIIASSVDEPLAEEIAWELPEDLTEEKLRSHQARELWLSSEDFIGQIAAQFDLDEDDARQLIETVLHVGEEALDEDSLVRLKEAVPQDVAAMM